MMGGGSVKVKKCRDAGRSVSSGCPGARLLAQGGAVCAGCHLFNHGLFESGVYFSAYLLFYISCLFHSDFLFEWELTYTAKPCDTPFQPIKTKTDLTTSRTASCRWLDFGRTVWVPTYSDYLLSSNLFSIFNYICT